MRVLPECDVLRSVAEQSRKSSTHACRLLKRAVPFLVHQLRRIEPGALLCLECNIGPGLMGMACQENPFTDSETGIVRGERIRHSEPTSDLPQVREQRPAYCCREIRRATRPTRSRLHADRAFDHLHVAIAPFLQAFVEIHEPFA